MRQKLKKNQKPPKRRSLRSKNRIKKLRQNLIKLWLSIRPLNLRQLRNLAPKLLKRTSSLIKKPPIKKIHNNSLKLKKKDIKKPCKEPPKKARRIKLSNSAAWLKRLSVPLLQPSKTSQLKDKTMKSIV
jgi:hypothetical protein